MGFDISCKLSPVETICTKCLSIFSGKNKKNIITLSSAEDAQRVVKVKRNEYTFKGGNTVKLFASLLNRGSILKGLILSF